MSDEVALRERFDGFNYDYRMRCECGATVTLHAEAYKRESTRGAQTPCESCGGSVHFGPSVAAIRDAHDRSLTRFPGQFLCIDHAAISVVV